MFSAERAGIFGQLFLSIVCSAEPLKNRGFSFIIKNMNGTVLAGTNNIFEVECEDCHERMWLHPESLSDICEQVDDEIISTDNPIIEDEFPRNLKPWPLNENSTPEEVAAFESCKVTMDDLQKRNWLHYSPRLLDRLTIFKGSGSGLWTKYS